MEKVCVYLIHLPRTVWDMARDRGQWLLSVAELAFVIYRYWRYLPRRFSLFLGRTHSDNETIKNEWTKCRFPVSQLTSSSLSDCPIAQLVCGCGFKKNQNNILYEPHTS